jgi:hypothetical protein
MGSKPLPRMCWICGKTVELEDCKIDEHGLAVHEDCYVAKILLEQNRGQNTLRSGGTHRHSSD